MIFVADDELKVKPFWFAFPWSAQALAGEFDPMGVMNETIQYGRRRKLDLR